MFPVDNKICLDKVPPQDCNVVKTCCLVIGECASTLSDCIIPETGGVSSIIVLLITIISVLVGIPVIIKLSEFCFNYRMCTKYNGNDGTRHGGITFCEGFALYFCICCVHKKRVGDNEDDEKIKKKGPNFEDEIKKGKGNKVHSINDLNYESQRTQITAFEDTISRLDVDTSTSRLDNDFNESKVEMI